MLTVVCWKWRSTGWRHGYNAIHVNALYRMIQRYLRIPHRFVCVTDDPRHIECETIPLWKEPEVNIPADQPNCYKRLFAFSEEARDILGDRVLSIDLDCVILGDITDLVDRPEPFVINRGIVCPYNGGMWMITPGVYDFVWSLFDPKVSPGLARQKRMPNGGRPYGSDQAWLYYCIDNAPTWGYEHGVYAFSEHYRDNQPKPIKPRPKIVFFAGRLKPWMPTIFKRAPELYEHYQQFLNVEHQKGSPKVANV